MNIFEPFIGIIIWYEPYEDSNGNIDEYWKDAEKTEYVAYIPSCDIKSAWIEEDFHMRNCRTLLIEKKMWAFK